MCMQATIDLTSFRDNNTKGTNHFKHFKLFKRNFIFYTDYIKQTFLNNFFTLLNILI